MEQLLDSIQVPSHLFHGDQCCGSSFHMHEIENYFQSLLEVVVLADSHIPRNSNRGKSGKGFWTDRLTQLKRDSVESYEIWCDAGRPSSGRLFECKKHDHYVYKAELRLQRRRHAATKSDALNDKLMAGNHMHFWRRWRSVSQVKCPPVNRIGDAAVPQDIANNFKTYFQQIYGDDATEPHGDLRRDFHERFSHYLSSKESESIRPYLLSWQDMVTIIGKLKKVRSQILFSKLNIYLMVALS